MNPERYGWQHLTYITIVVVLSILLFVLGKIYAKSSKAKTIIVKSLAACLLVAIVTNRFSIVFKTNPAEWKWIIPDSLCGISSVAMSVTVLLGKRNNVCLHAVWLVALLCGSLVTVYPDFLGQNPSFMYLPTITGLLHHSLAAVVSISLFVFNYIELSYKKWQSVILGFMCYLAMGAFLITVIGHDDAIHMINPILPNTPLTIWFVAPLYFVLYAIIILIVELVRKKKNKKIQGNIKLA